MPDTSRRKNATTRKLDSDHTIAESLEYLCAGSSTRKSPPAWPPDVFALTALLLLRAGAYRQALVKWPPYQGWEGRVDRLGKAWRSAWNRGQAPPRDVITLWRKVLQYKNNRLDSICKECELSDALIQLCAIADATAYAVGLPIWRATDYDNFYEHGFKRLWPNEEHGSTLCEEIHTTRVRVLPKMHTPQTGLTIRSFSHNLALYGSDEMRPDWYMVPNDPGDNRLNLLLVPWPYKVKGEQFVAVKGKIEMPRKYGFFEYRPRATGDDPAAKVKELMAKAHERGWPIDGVILPELALTEPQHRNVRDVVLTRKAFLIAGVATPTGSGETANKVYFDLPILETENVVRIRQSKHHRWQLDGWQIARYGLERILDPAKLWWEHIPLEERCLNIVAMRPWLTISVLVCEDLARPDPVGDLVRAVGPNLVVSLLADGPQLPRRWSARYAMALADDPGCSVLTLTSLGMAQLGNGGKGKSSRAVGLWKNGQSGVVQEIDLPPKKEAAVLEIDIKRVEEFTADGRSDGRNAGVPTLENRKKVHYV